jgi:N-acetylglucosamine kinase-like BadF-type ATPase
VYILGIDSGAGSTLALLGTPDGRLLALGRAGPTGALISAEGRAQLERELAAVVADTLARAGLQQARFRSSWLAMTGVFPGGPDEATVTDCARQLFESGQLGAGGDIEAALQGASGGEPGVLVYAGTGSIAYGRDAAGNTVRIGGWGYLLDDRGGAYHLGLAALRELALAADGREPATLLHRPVLAACGVGSVEELRRSLFASETVDRTLIARLAPLVSSAAQAGDAAALRVIHGAAHSLADLAATAVTALAELPSPQPVHVSGGVFKAGEVLLEPFRRRLQAAAPDAVVRPGQFEPVVGSYLLALRQAGVPLTAGLLQRVRAGWRELAELP